jgi:demethylmenaquinone methyltransferase/2-methoxy-6-polyprenyl-1,4-benzoquinol methylase
MMNAPPQPEPSRREVWRMFDRISPGYDRLNRVISAGMDQRWRAEVARLLPAGRDLRVLDLATGTGDQLIALWQSGRVREAVGLDLAEQMLAIGRKKVAALGPGVRFGVGDAQAIPEPDACFHAVSISFGIRNVPDVPQALREMRRVLRPGGRALILESSLPGNRLMRAGHLFYIRHVMPRLGAWLSGDRDAYRYLNVTIERFPHGADFCRLMEDAGFLRCAAHPRCAGAVTIYQGDAPGGGA